MFSQLLHDRDQLLSEYNIQGYYTRWDDLIKEIKEIDCMLLG